MRERRKKPGVDSFDVAFDEEVLVFLLVFCCCCCSSAFPPKNAMLVAVAFLHASPPKSSSETGANGEAAAAAAALRMLWATLSFSFLTSSKRLSEDLRAAVSAGPMSTKARGRDVADE